VAVSLILIALSSCSLLPVRGEQEPHRQEGPPEAVDGSLQREFGQSEVLRALVQFHHLVGSFEEFKQYREGFPSYEHYLETVFLLEDGPYYPGRAVSVNLYDEDGAVRHRLTRSLLEETARGRWWGIRQVQAGSEIYCEVRVGPRGLPREVRYRHPQSGEVVARRTEADQYAERVLREQGEEYLERELAERRSREMNSNLPVYYPGIVEIRRDEVETKAGRLRAAFFSNPDGPRGIAVWYSPDVLGNILKIVKPGGAVLAELAERSGGHTRRYTDVDRQTVTPPLAPQ
jgi:hypothetical protein